MRIAKFLSTMLLIPIGPSGISSQVFQRKVKKAVSDNLTTFYEDKPFFIFGHQFTVVIYLPGLVMLCEDNCNKILKTDYGGFQPVSISISFSFFYPVLPGHLYDRISAIP